MLTYVVGGMGLLAGESLVGSLWAPTLGTATASAHAITQGTLSGAPNYVITQFTPGTLKIEIPPTLFNTMNQPIGLFMDRPFNANMRVFAFPTTTVAPTTTEVPNTTPAADSSTSRSTEPEATQSDDSGSSDEKKKRGALSSEKDQP